MNIDLTKHSWNTIVYNEDANLANDHFLHTFTKLYNKHCPLKYSQPKVAKLNKKNAWFTKGLKKACIKKKLLFKKTYKIKVTGILRSTKRVF